MGTDLLAASAPQAPGPQLTCPPASRCSGAHSSLRTSSSKSLPQLRLSGPLTTTRRRRPRWAASGRQPAIGRGLCHGWVRKDFDITLAPSLHPVCTPPAVPMAPLLGPLLARRRSSGPPEIKAREPRGRRRRRRRRKSGMVVGPSDQAQRPELESDLIAACFSATRSVPALQVWCHPSYSMRSPHEGHSVTGPTLSLLSSAGGPLSRPTQHLPAICESAVRQVITSSQLVPERSTKYHASVIETRGPRCHCNVLGLTTALSTVHWEVFA